MMFAPAVTALHFRYCNILIVVLGLYCRFQGELRPRPELCMAAIVRALQQQRAGRANEIKLGHHFRHSFADPDCNLFFDLFPCLAFFIVVQSSVFSARALIYTFHASYPSHAETSAATSMTACQTKTWCALVSSKSKFITATFRTGRGACLHMFDLLTCLYTGFSIEFMVHNVHQSTADNITVIETTT